jgi:acyl carrier protein
MQITRELLRSYLQDFFGIDIRDVDDATKLFSDGLLDSFSVADMLLFIEEKGDFVVEPEEVTYDNIDSIANILAYAKRKCESPSD